MFSRFNPFDCIKSSRFQINETKNFFVIHMTVCNFVTRIFSETVDLYSLHIQTNVFYPLNLPWFVDCSGIVNKISNNFQKNHTENRTVSFCEKCGLLIESRKKTYRMCHVWCRSKKLLQMCSLFFGAK